MSIYDNVLCVLCEPLVLVICWSDNVVCLYIACVVKMASHAIFQYNVLVIDIDNTTLELILEGFIHVHQAHSQEQAKEQPLHTWKEEEW